ncbi:ABC transporter permease [Nocardia sp. CDC153]|uniref:ABC transporter permease n=1 Tax=Nocardia sp. CDC153 TaxID=3112167 RepID=UPI002DB97D4C|nr:ABC transporter permease [Nocardia sp. CDC153]MEC3952032.1 ABC transporter permease [Nocardia sp. CDC153]
MVVTRGSSVTAPQGNSAFEPSPDLNRLPWTALPVDSLALAKRQILHIIRTPQAAVAAVTSPILFLTLFRYVFGGAIPIPGMTYVDYIVPAMLVQNVVFGGFTSATGLATDAADGIIDRFRSLPSPRAALLSGRALADVLQQFVAHALCLVAGIAIGFRFHASVGDILLSFAMLLVIGLGTFSLFAFLGLAARNAETVNALTAPGFLMVFVSSAFIPVSTLPGWLQGFARYQPVTIFTDTLRTLMQKSQVSQVLEHSTAWYATASVAWCVVLTVIGGALALRAYRKV